MSAQHAQSRPSTVQLPPDAEMRAYAACQDALWALDSLGQVFIRTLSASCPTGMHWARLDLSQLGRLHALLPHPPSAASRGDARPASWGPVFNHMTSWRPLGRSLDFRKPISRSCKLTGLLRVL